jgi:acid stress-induced BolA-like protein IbaG/YrbA
MVRLEDIENALRAKLPVAHLALDGDGRHFELLIVSDAFVGLSRVRRHQAIYGALGDAMRDELVHALTMQTLTAEEWANRG